MYNPPVYLKTWGSADPDQACPGRRRCFYIMLCVGSKIKGFSLFSFVDLIAYVDFDGTLKHVSEFLTFVWKIRVGCTARSQGKTCLLYTSDRILHSKAFRRMKQKTQVFLLPIGDHYRTRLTHTLEVSQNARTIGKALRLNEDLVEAIALGHDLGHTPFGHAGERALNNVCPCGFKHNEQSVRVVEVLEKQGEGLNLTWEVIDGIRNHKSAGMPATVSYTHLFVMELPQYHIPQAKTVLLHVWERLKGFIIKAGTILFLACVVMWFLGGFGFVDGSFGMVEDSADSLMAMIGGVIAPLFAPLGFGEWQPVAASISGFTAKEAIVSTMGVLANVSGDTEDAVNVAAGVASWFPSSIAAFTFLMFNLLDSPCLAAIADVYKRQGQSTSYDV